MEHNDNASEHRLRWDSLAARADELGLGRLAGLVARGRSLIAPGLELALTAGASARANLLELDVNELNTLCPERLSVGRLVHCRPRSSLVSRLCGAVNQAGWCGVPRYLLPAAFAAVAFLALTRAVMRARSSPQPVGDIVPLASGAPAAIVWKSTVTGAIARAPSDVLWCDSLVARLQVYAGLRERNVGLLLELHARARSWQLEHGVSDSLMARIMPGSIAEAFALSPEQRAACVRLTAADVASSIQVTRNLHAGAPLRPHSLSVRGFLTGQVGFTDIKAAAMLWLRGGDVGLPLR